MGIRFQCPGCQRNLNVKSFLAGKRAICPKCTERFTVPMEDQIPASQSSQPSGRPGRFQTANLAPDVRSRVAVSRQQATHQQATHQQATGQPHISPDHDSDSQREVVAASKQSASATCEPPEDDLQFRRPAPDWDDQKSAEQVLKQGTAEGESLGQMFEDLDPASFQLDRPQEMPLDQPSGHYDWIAESPQSVWYVRHANGSQYGPAVGRQMRGWVSEGRVTERCHVWREGWAHWRQAVDVFPQIRSNPPVMEMPGPASRQVDAGTIRAGNGSTARGEVQTAETPSTPRSGNRWLFPAVLFFLLVVAMILAGFVYYVLNQMQEKGSPASASPGRDHSTEIVDPFAGD